VQQVQLLAGPDRAGRRQFRESDLMVFPLEFFCCCTHFTGEGLFMARPWSLKDRSVCELPAFEPACVVHTGIRAGPSRLPYAS